MNTLILYSKGRPAIQNNIAAQLVVLDGSINDIKLLHCPLNTKQCSAVDKSWQHRKKFRERRESNLGPLGAKRERYPLCYAVPPAAQLVCHMKVS